MKCREHTVHVLIDTECPTDRVCQYKTKQIVSTYSVIED